MEISAPAPRSLLNESQIEAHRLQNFFHSVVLVVGIGGLAAFSAWLVWGLWGVFWASVGIAVMLLISTRTSPALVMRMFGAKPVTASNGGQLLDAVRILAERAELPAVPKLYFIPSKTLNAFAVGRPEKASIGITHGILKALNLREIIGVLAHEISHVRNNDLWIMGLADTMSKFTQVMSTFGLFSLIGNLGLWLFGMQPAMPWLAALTLYLMPAAGSLLQLALSRAREHDADLEGAYLTGDPDALATALQKLERHQGRMWEDMLPTGRRIPIPSVLRSHPTTKERVERLSELKRKAPPMTPIPVDFAPDGQTVTVANLGTHRGGPRYRITTVWY